jgi:hypothetical protein
MGGRVSQESPSSKLGIVVVLLRAFAARSRVPPRKVRDKRVSRAAVEVTSDYGIAPIFPGMR